MTLEFNDLFSESDSDKDAKKRFELMANPKKFTTWLKNSWEDIPIIEGPKHNQTVTNREGILGQLVAKWDSTHYIVDYGKKGDDILEIEELRKELRDAFVVREAWAGNVVSIYPYNKT